MLPRCEHDGFCHWLVGDRYSTGPLWVPWGTGEARWGPPNTIAGVPNTRCPFTSRILSRKFSLVSFWYKCVSLVIHLFCPLCTYSSSFVCRNTRGHSPASANCNACWESNRGALVHEIFMDLLVLFLFRKLCAQILWWVCRGLPLTSCILLFEAEFLSAFWCCLLPESAVV